MQLLCFIRVTCQDLHSGWQCDRRHESETAEQEGDRDGHAGVSWIRSQ